MCLGWVPRVTPVTDGGMSSSALAAIIAAVAAFLAVVIILLIICVLIMSRRRRLAKANYKTSAHDNPTYMTHRDINANLAAAAAAAAADGSASPVDLVFDVDGTSAAIFYADDEKKKVKL